MTTPSVGLLGVKGVALGVTDAARAHRFYAEILGLAPVFEGEGRAGYQLGGTILMLKDDGSMPPTAAPNYRVTLEVSDARATEAALKGLGVTISDPVELYEGAYYVGGFLDSEGNKLWFCSEKAPD